MKTTIGALALLMLAPAGCIERRTTPMPEDLTAVRALVAREAHLDATKAGMMQIEMVGNWARVSEHGHVAWIVCRHGSDWEIVGAGPDNHQVLPGGVHDRSRCAEPMPTAWSTP